MRPFSGSATGFRPASQADSFTLGNGSYKMEAMFLGGGFVFRL